MDDRKSFEDWLCEELGIKSAQDDLFAYLVWRDPEWRRRIFSDALISHWAYERVKTILSEVADGKFGKD